MEEIFPYLLRLISVGILWGVTNPLLKKYSVGIENVKYESHIKQVSGPNHIHYFSPSEF